MKAKMHTLVYSLWLGALCSTAAADWIASPETGWPQFRGPRRNGISTETGLLQSWPEGGPPVVWSATNLGSGYSSPILVGQRLYLTGDVGNELHIFALDLAGKLQWTATNGAAWKGPYPGARASCTYAAGRLYHLNANGRLSCFDASDGREIWNADVVSPFETKVPTWGMSECLLVDGRKVIVTLGGRKASMAAFDKDTGKVIWTAPALPDDALAHTNRIEGPSYVSPVLVEVLGQRHIIAVTARHFFGVDIETGKVQWTSAMPTTYEVLACPPVLCGDAVFVTGPDGGGGRLLRLARNAAGRISAEQSWTTTLDTLHGGVIALDGILYGSWYRSYNGWGAVDLKDGSVPYRDKTLAMGSVVLADGRFYCLSQAGTMALVKPDPAKWDVVSRFQFVRERRTDVWAHPVILNGRLYLRHQQSLVCFDIRDPRSEPKH